ncbi:MAG: rubredoxin [Desulfovibrionaceae bacterium]
MGKANEMYQCQVHYCGYVYDPEVGEPKAGIAPGTRFEDLPDGFKCPFCGAGKQLFKPLAGPGSVHWENIKSNPAFKGMSDEELEKMYVDRDVRLESPDAKRAQ